MIDWSTKLQGAEYRRYWQQRMAKGPSQAGWHDYSKAETEKQGQQIWDFIECDLVGIPFAPNWVVEFGSGFGRMLKKLRELWPDARLLGVELADAARKNSWQDDGTVLVSTIPPADFHADLVFTCTALQHVTDQETFTETVNRILKALLPVAYLTLFENVNRSGAKHVLDFNAADYMACFPGVTWREPRILKLRGEPHAWMMGVKQ